MRGSGGEDGAFFCLCALCSGWGFLVGCVEAGFTWAVSRDWSFGVVGWIDRGSSWFRCFYVLLRWVECVCVWIWSGLNRIGIESQVNRIEGHDVRFLRVRVFQVLSVLGCVCVKLLGHRLQVSW